MGRSQLQYRARGRGGRDGQHGGRGGRHGDTKELESNAFRFMEEEGDEEDSFNVSDNEGERAEPTHAKAKDLRFNPDVQQLTQSTGGAGHFQTKVMREWDEENKNDTPAMALDLHEIGRQLETIAPNKRFSIDSKYCIDLTCMEVGSSKASPSTSTLTTMSTPTIPTTSIPAPTPSASSASSTAASSSLTVQVDPSPAAKVVPSPPKPVATTMSSLQSLPPARPAPTSCEIDDELDELLNM